MLITEAALRDLIREVLLTEGITNKHGYSVNAIDDVKWSADKMSIPKRANPFVGSSAAFDDWYNDGEMTKEFMLTIYRGTPMEKRMLMRNDVFFKEGSFVIIPDLWRKGLKTVFRIEPPGIFQSSASRVPGANELDSIPLVNIRDPKEALPYSNVGIAFLRNVGGPRSEMSDARANAREYMEGAVSEEKPESRFADDSDRKVVRRRAGEPMPRPPVKPAAPRPMTPEERAMLLGRRR